MTAAGVVLVCTVLGAAGVLGTGLVFVLRALWQIRGSWDATNARLTALVVQVTNIVARKDEDHGRIDRRADEISGRLERHLDWHATQNKP